jgi:uncharacterized phage protein (TIGR01671 family)
MREIKFRAWSKQNKLMHYVDKFSSNPQLMTWNGIVYKQGVVQDYEMLQYTGLKDKNGEEIYEGDVVNIVDFNTQNYRVEFINGTFLLRYGYANIENRYPEDVNYGSDVEVIGNIYENELLESKL